MAGCANNPLVITGRGCFVEIPSEYSDHRQSIWERLKVEESAMAQELLRYLAESRAASDREWAEGDRRLTLITSAGKLV
jgi:hypothetical protein